MRSIVRTFAGLAALVLATSVLVAQQNTTVPQPRAGALPPPATASPKPSRAVSRPEGMSPKAANGFTVTMAADLRAPRMMVYAPNGDLFVSSPVPTTSPCCATRTTTACSNRRAYTRRARLPPRAAAVRLLTLLAASVQADRVGRPVRRQAPDAALRLFSARARRHAHHHRTSL